MAVLVTGVGYIGAVLVQRLLARGEEVVAVDNFFSTDARAIAALRQHKGFRLVKGSITSASTLRQAFSAVDIAVVYSLAAQASANPEAASARYTETTNLIGPRLLLDCALEFGVKRLVYGSSFKVYGPQLPAEVSEDTAYGVFSDISHLSKCYGEKLLEIYSSRHQLSCLALRLGIVYGVSPVMKRDYRFMTAPNKFCLQAVRGETVELHPGSDLPAGFIHVTDAAAAMIEAADNADLRGYVPINAAPEVYSVAEVAGLVADQAARRDFRLDVRGRTDATGKSASERVTVKSRLQPFFAEPRHRLPDAIGEIIDHFRDHSRE